MLLENLQFISPQKAKDSKLFGPVYHGTTSDKLEKINTQGFKITIGHERMGDISHGYEISDYYGGIPAPIHHLGYGIYFTTVKSIAQQFSYGNPNIGPYFLDIPRMEIINWGSPHTMMKWWLENGYDYKKTAETMFGYPETNFNSIRQERIRATINLTNNLKSKYDGIWYKGRGIRRFLDGDQVVIFDPNKIYKLDKSLVKSGEIGSKIVAKVGIDPYGRGEIKVPIGTKGIIIDKKKPHPEQKWAEGSEWLYSVKWDKGGVMWNVIDQWIEPYIKPTKKKLSENQIYKRNFWKMYEKSYNLNETEKDEYYPVSKKDEYRVVNAIVNDFIPYFGENFAKTLEKINHRKKVNLGMGTGKKYFDIINYKAINDRNEIVIFDIRFMSNWVDDYGGIGYILTDSTTNKMISWKIVIPFGSKSLNEEKSDKIYYPISKKEEHEIVDSIKKRWMRDTNNGDELCKNFIKIRHDRKVKLSSTHEFDIINYQSTIDGLPLFFHIRKSYFGLGYTFFAQRSDGKIVEHDWTLVIPSLHNSLTESTLKKMPEHQCFNNSRKWAIHNDNGKTFVVHGKVINVERKKLDHAWVEQNDYVIDPTQGVRINKEKWYELMSAQPESKYTPVQASINMIKTSNHGPWTKEEVENRFIWREDSKTEIKENENDYIPITKKEEYEVLNSIIHRFDKRDGGQLSKTIEKIKHERRSPTWGHDIIIYKGYSNGKLYVFTITSTFDMKSVGYIVKANFDVDFADDPFFSVVKRSEKNVLKENDSDHGESLRKTGYWGKQGAGAIILSKRTGRILLPYRSINVLQPHTWGVWGGAIDDGENPSQAVKREISEEVGYNKDDIELIPLYVYQDPKVGFRYSNFLAIVDNEFQPRLNWETEKYKWVKFGEWPQPIHFGLKALLENSTEKISEEINKNVVNPTQSKSIDKEKYKAAIHIIRMTWNDMNSGGEYKNRFDYENSFIHWMLNSTVIDKLLSMYGKQFYPNINEPEGEFIDDIKKVLEMLERKYNERISKKINALDPLFILKQVVRGKTWKMAKKGLSDLRGGSAFNIAISDDVAEDCFNLLYRSAMGETFYDAKKMYGTKRLNQYILTKDTPNYEKVFLQHYLQKNEDRFPDVVKVWRGLHTPTAKIRPGDFVTFDKSYAGGYKTGKYGSIISDNLPSKDLIVVMPNPKQSHLIYWPEGHQIKKVENVPTFREFYNQWAFP